MLLQECLYKTVSSTYVFLKYQVICYYNPHLSMGLTQEHFAHKKPELRNHFSSPLHSVAVQEWLIKRLTG